MCRRGSPDRPGRGLLDPDDGRRLDVRPDPVERAIGGSAGCGLGRRLAAGQRRPDRLARTLAHAVGRAVAPGLSGAVGFGGAVAVPRGIGEPRAARIGVQLTAPAPTPSRRDTMEDDLVASGRFVRIETRGALSGEARAVTVGFVDDDPGNPAGALLVAAGSEEAAWARNLEADPRCHARVGTRSFDAIAEPLGRDEHARAIRDLILRYGTPSEGLGRGPSFRLRPVTPVVG